tara:strand:- start:859 stop:1767 length:909 start_codon:yes stop_codon:yes gene_type:complete
MEFHDILNYERSDYFNKLWSSHLVKNGGLPNRKNISNFSFHPLVFSSVDEVVQDASLCRTSMNDRFYNEIKLGNYEIVGTTKAAEFYWVLTDQTLFIVNEYHDFGIGIELLSIEIIEAKSNLIGQLSGKFSGAAGRTTLKLEGKVSSAPENTVVKIPKIGESIEIEITSHKVGIRDLTTQIKHFKNLNTEFENNRISKYVLQPLLQGEPQVDRTIGLILWLIPKTREIIHAGTTPAALELNKETTRDMLQVLIGIFEGFEDGVRTNKEFLSNELVELSDMIKKIYEIKFDKSSGNPVEVVIL